MLAVSECVINNDDTGSTLHDKLMALGATTLLSALPAIAEGTQSAIKQNDEAACYAAKLSKAEAKINWQQSAVEIQRTIRAYNAWPVAFCQYEKNARSAKLRLWQAELSADETPASGVTPGTVIAESAMGIDVATLAGVLRITELQAEGKRRMSVADFLNANSLVNQVLG
jgi:methionyl-tRNA formyltransferase